MNILIGAFDDIDTTCLQWPLLDCRFLQNPAFDLRAQYLPYMESLEL